MGASSSAMARPKWIKTPNSLPCHIIYRPMHLQWILAIVYIIFTRNHPRSKSARKLTLVRVS